VERCVSCHFYDRHNGHAKDGKSSNAGVCRRTAPQLHPVNVKSYMIEGVWPTVRDDDWCGEWKVLVRRADPGRLHDTLGAALAPRPQPETAPRGTVISATPVQPPPRPLPLPPGAAGGPAALAFVGGPGAD